MSWPIRRRCASMRKPVSWLPELPARPLSCRYLAAFFSRTRHQTLPRRGPQSMIKLVFAKRLIPSVLAVGFAAAARRIVRRWPRRRRQGAAGAASGDLRSQAVEIARQPRHPGGARAHPVRFFRQCLRGLRAAIPPGVGARFRRGQSRAQRFALHHLGRRRGQEVSLQFGKSAQRPAAPTRSTAMPNAMPRRSRST